jgi:hypothetical protein
MGKPSIISTHGKIILTLDCRDVPSLTREKHETNLNSPLTLDTEYVVGFMEKAVTAKSPPPRFLVGAGSWILTVLRLILPTSWNTAFIAAAASPSVGKKL